jgi:hypothetical protein
MRVLQGGKAGFTGRSNIRHWGLCDGRMAAPFKAPGIIMLIVL